MLKAKGKGSQTALRKARRTQMPLSQPVVRGERNKMLLLGIFVSCRRWGRGEPGWMERKGWFGDVDCVDMVVY